MQKRIAYLIFFLFFVLLLAGYANSINNKKAQSNNSSCDNEKTIAFETPANEILSAEIDVNGGVLRGKDNAGQWIVINIPPGAVKQKTKINLSLEKSAYQVRSGVKSPLSFSITPDIIFDRPVRATIVYDKKFSCDKISTIVPYLIKEDGSLSAAQIVGLYKNQNIFTMDTFHGGTYSWVYVK